MCVCGVFFHRELVDKAFSLVIVDKFSCDKEIVLLYMYSVAYQESTWESFLLNE